jgi:hypothetical protein
LNSFAFAGIPTDMKIFNIIGPGSRKGRKENTAQRTQRKAKLFAVLCENLLRSLREPVLSQSFKMLRTFIVIACSVTLLFAFQDCKKTTPTHLNGCFTITPSTDSVFQTFTFTNCSKGATLWHWYFGDGDSDIVDFSTTHLYQIPGYYTVTLVTLDAFGDSNVVREGLLVKALSTAYPGTFGGYDACSLSGVDSTVITISSVSDTIVSIYNLYNTGKTFVAYAEGFTLTIPPQTFNNSAGNMLIQGSIQLQGNTTTEVFNSLTLSIIVTGFSTRDVCQATLYK